MDPFGHHANGLHVDERGLLPVVAQDRLTGEIRMVAFATLGSVRHTLETGRATFFSRSRNELWEKGSTSGSTMNVAGVLVDCDADCLIYLVTPHGPSCHTEAPSCFFRRAVLKGDNVDIDDAEVPAPTLLARLERVLEARKSDDADRSYTKSLYDAGPEKIGEKLREEASELAVAMASEDDARVVSEAADVVFHMMVALRFRGITIDRVLGELDRRAGTSGHDEKRSRHEP